MGAHLTSIRQIRPIRRICTPAVRRWSFAVARKRGRFFACIESPRNDAKAFDVAMKRPFCCARPWPDPFTTAADPMTKPPRFIPSTISPEAQVFIRDVVLPEPHVITRGTIGAIREANAAAFAPAAEAMREAHLERVADEEVSGVPVQACTSGKACGTSSSTTRRSPKPGRYPPGRPPNRAQLRRPVTSSLAPRATPAPRC